MRQSEIIRYYSKPEISAELVRFAQNREMGVQFRSGAFGKRPDILQFPGDVINLVRKGAVSFHSSEEHWSDPLQLSSESTKKDLNELRTGWDFIIDIDCPWFDYSKICAISVIEALKEHGIENISIKFSGNRGWHIGVPFESFPSKIGKKQFSDLFPHSASAMLSYLKDYISENMRIKIEKYEGDLKNILKKTGKKREEFIKEEQFDFFSLIGLDLALGAPRHLFRAPYSLHEKTGLVSVPIKIEDLEKFEKSQAEPDKIEEVIHFLGESKPDEATQLLVQALDRQEIPEEDAPKRIINIQGKVSKDRFPPCIKEILKGLEDGRKRSLFVLIDFLRNINWDWQEIEKEVRDWNNKNNPPLRSSYLNGQLKWHQRQRQKFPPPNCHSENYYKDISTCKPDAKCRGLKNPLAYVKRK